VNAYTTGTQDAPVAIADAAGNVTVAWVSEGDGAQDGDGAGIFGRRFDSTGGPLTSEVPVNTYTLGAQTAPAIAGTAAGEFVVVWESDGQDGDARGVFGQRFDASGTPLGSEFQVNGYTAGDQRDPAVAVDAGGGFVVSWTSDGQDGDGAGVFARRYDASGTPLAGEFQVNTYTTSLQDQSSVAVLPSGEILVAWSSVDQGQIFAAMRGVYGQLYDAAGLPIGGELTISEWPFDQTDPLVLPGSGGLFTIVNRDTTTGRLAVVDTTGTKLLEQDGVTWGEAAALDAAGNVLIASAGTATARWLTNPVALYSAGTLEGPTGIPTSSGLGGALLGAVGAFGDQEFIAIGSSNGDLVGRRFTNCTDPGFGPPCSDHPIAARKVTISKNFPGELKFVTKDPTFPFPSIGGPDDPRQVGMSVSLVTPAGVHTTGIAAAPFLWVATDAVADRYVYTSGGLFLGYRIAIKVKEGFGITIRLPDPLALEPPIGTLGVRIQFGDTRMCAFFGPLTVRADTTTKFTAVDAPVGSLTDCSDQSLGLP